MEVAKEEGGVLSGRVVWSSSRSTLRSTSMGWCHLSRPVPTNPTIPDASELPELPDVLTSEFCPRYSTRHLLLLVFLSLLMLIYEGGESERSRGRHCSRSSVGPSSAACYHRSSWRPRALADILQLRPEAHARLRVYSGPTGDRWRLGHGGARRTRLTLRTVVFAWGIYASLSPRGGKYRRPARGACAADGRAGFRLQD
jgi:hypothetical protein